VTNELLQHEIVVESLGGDTQIVEVSAKTGQGLDELIERILLQAEVLDLKANPDRTADGVVIEAKLDKGRGAVSTVLVKRGTLKKGDIVVAGASYGRVRALLNERSEQLNEAGPSTPVEILGLDSTPSPGEAFAVVESEARARELTEYRQRVKREKSAVGGVAGASLADMMAKLSAKKVNELPLVIKGDVQGSVEAIVGSLDKIGTDEVRARIILQGAGAISESDVQLAKGAGAPIIGFNVRASAQARALAEREGVEIRYYSIIYDLTNDMKAGLTGLLSPTKRENFLGNAEIREVFNITKSGKVAGCRVTEGLVKRGAKVRLLRDSIVIHEGTLKTLRRFKDEVREVQEGYECGMAFENYEDIKVGDIIECFEVESVARVL
jgi:translation initiation factor IF-2